MGRKVLQRPHLSNKYIRRKKARIVYEYYQPSRLTRETYGIKPCKVQKLSRHIQKINTGIRGHAKNGE